MKKPFSVNHSSPAICPSVRRRLDRKRSMKKNTSNLHRTFLLLQLRECGAGASRSPHERVIPPICGATPDYIWCLVRWRHWQQSCKLARLKRYWLRIFQLIWSINNIKTIRGPRQAQRCPWQGFSTHFVSLQLIKLYCCGYTSVI